MIAQSGTSRALVGCLVLVGWVLGATAVSADRPPEPICWFERFFFEQATAEAGEARPIPADLGSQVETVRLPLEGGGHLCGYRVSSYRERGAPRLGHVLFVQGNGMVATRVIRPLVLLSDLGFDVYAFDFRGYGCSDGEPLAVSMFEDYRTILRRLDAWHPGDFQAAYGVSWGGIVLVNAVDEAEHPDALVLDAVPDRLPALFFCPREVDPAHRLEALAVLDGVLTVVVNGEDPQVPARKMRRNLRHVEGGAEGALIHLRDSGHPFAGLPPVAEGDVGRSTTERMERVGAVLVRRARAWNERPATGSVP